MGPIGLLDGLQGVDSIAVTVPDLDVATGFFAEIAGAVEEAGRRRLVRHGRQARLAVDNTTALLLTEHASTDKMPPRVTDLGTHHLCLRVTDIDAATGFLRDELGLGVLGDVITVPDGPIRGNRWIYFRLPWGPLAELQQWSDVRIHETVTSTRLWFGQRPLSGARLPSLLGVDHTGHSVRDLDATIRFLSGRFGAVEVLRTEIAADAAFMRAQLDVDLGGRSLMAMLRLGSINIELFQHDVAHQAEPRATFDAGGCALVLSVDDLTAATAELGTTSDPDTGFQVLRTGFGPDLALVRHDAHRLAGQNAAGSSTSAPGADG